MPSGQKMPVELEFLVFIFFWLTLESSSHKTLGLLKKEEQFFEKRERGGAVKKIR